MIVSTFPSDALVNAIIKEILRYSEEKVTHMLLYTNTMTNSEILQTADTHLYLKVDEFVPQSRTVNLRKSPIALHVMGQPRKDLRDLSGARSGSRLLVLGANLWAFVVKG